MDIDLEDAHQQINEIESLIESGKFSDARKAIMKLVGALENMAHHLKTMKKPPE